MKVKTLKKLLQNYNDEDEIIMAKDEEGNYFSPLVSLEEVLYVPETTYSGTVYLKGLNDDLRDIGFTEEDLYDGNNGVNAIALYSTN